MDRRVTGRAFLKVLLPELKFRVAQASRFFKAPQVTVL